MTGTGGKTMSDRRDRLYADLLADVEAFVFDDKVAAVFPDMIRRSVPGYGTVIALTGVIAARYYQPDSRIYDLVCAMPMTIRLPSMSPSLVQTCAM
jgi:tRNA (cmo5U34)-methyltransferase